MKKENKIKIINKVYTLVFGGNAHQQVEDRGKTHIVFYARWFRLEDEAGKAITNIFAGFNPMDAYCNEQLKKMSEDEITEYCLEQLPELIKCHMGSKGTGDLQKLYFLPTPPPRPQDIG